MDFYSSIAENYNSIFPINPAQISFVNSIVSEHSSVLDIGCGTGTLANSLADFGHEVSAIDPDDKMLEIAVRNSSTNNPVFSKLGMMDVGKPPLDGTFDLVICFGNTVVHLTEPESIGLFFKNVRKVIPKGGKFSFQIINYDNVLDNRLTGLPTIENNYVRFERNYRLISKGTIDFETICTIKKDGQCLINCVELYPLRKNQAEELLTEAGFQNIQIFSSFKKDPYNPSTLPLIFVCS